jgi:Fe-S cluster biosynthesis and repair protein YggX
MARNVQCVKLCREAEGLDFAPLPGPLGKRVFDNVSKEAWQGWLRYQTMLINENRLSLADLRARQYLTEQLEAYFFGDGVDTPSGYTPQSGQ